MKRLAGDTAAAIPLLRDAYVGFVDSGHPEAYAPVLLLAAGAALLVQRHRQHRHTFPYHLCPDFHGPRHFLHPGRPRR